MTQWIDAAALDEIEDEDVMRFDHGGQTYAIYRVDGDVYASDGLCTHEHVHLCDGLVMGHTIECPKHNGRFDIRDGRALCAPVCEKLKTYPARVEAGRIFIEI
jgi:3-phenylpropionate/trans-cinnamate dioxygenase ferredoxin component